MKKGKKLKPETWENVRKDIFTEEEIAESDKRVAKISEEIGLERTEDEIHHKTDNDANEGKNY